MRQTEFDQPDFLAKLRLGDEQAYRRLIRRFHGSLIGVAASIIGSRAQAEEVVQDAWLAVFSGIGAFEGRSSVVTWLFSIVLNRARTRASREGRLVGLPALMEGTNPGGRAVDGSAFKPDGHWIDAPRLWDELDPERIIGGRQLWDHVMEAIERLPSGQRAVITLRDMEGCEAEDVCALLEISPENQRVLLHRARGRVRQAIDGVTGEGMAGMARARAAATQRGSGSVVARLMVLAQRIAQLASPLPRRRYTFLPVEG
jgi:RNA polymerase sigma-70 factor (ECF subfamily)